MKPFSYNSKSFRRTVDVISYILLALLFYTMFNIGPNTYILGLCVMHLLVLHISSEAENILKDDIKYILIIGGLLITYSLFIIEIIN